MVAQNRLRGPYSPPEDQDGWGASMLPPLSLAEIHEILGKAVRAGLKYGALTVFLVLLTHTDAIGRVAGRADRIAADTNLKPDTVRHILGDLKRRGELEEESPGAGRRLPRWRIARMRVWP